MRYALESQIVSEIAPLVARFHGRRILRYGCRAISWPIIVLACLGVLVAPAVVISLPLQLLLFIRTAPLSVAYWVPVCVTLVCTLWLLGRFGRAAILGLRQRRMDLEAILGFVGWGFAVAYLIWRLSR